MSQMNLQDVFLNGARREKIPLTIHVTNGYQIKDAVITGYDNFVVMILCGGKQMMIYKHAISTVTPSAPIRMIAAKDGREGNENKESTERKAEQQSERNERSE